MLKSVGTFLHRGVASSTGVALHAHAQSGPPADGPVKPFGGAHAANGAGYPDFAAMPALRTFIVEDSPIILDNLIATLEEMAPVQVVGNAADEDSAMASLAKLQGELDLVIIDVFLKSGSGLGILRGATRHGLTAKRVVLTNYATPDMRDKCKALGADRVFDKSNDLDELLAYCSRLAEGHDTTPGKLN